jgi:hypothetical protein
VKLSYLAEVLQKFAVSGGTYARALQNAATRGGGRVGAPVLRAIANQPRAKLMPGLSQQARQSAELPTNVPGRNQALFDRLPRDINTETPLTGRGDPRQRARFDAALRRGGAVHQQPGTQAAIDASFGPPTKAREQTSNIQPARPRMLGAAQPGVAASDRTSVMSAAPSVAPSLGQRAATNVLQVKRRGGPVKVASFGSMAAKAAPYALGIGIPLAAAGGILASKPGIQANLRNLRESKGTVQEKDLSTELPPEVLDTATRAHAALTERGIDPTNLRIAVDAPPGSGKTTLSRALAQQLGVQHYGLDWLPHNKFHSIMGGGHIEKMPRAPRAGEILEHYNLLRSYDPEMFDVAFHIQKDPEVIKQQILNRGRSAGMHTIMDYDKSLAVGRMAFDTLSGDAVDLGGGVMMKVRPQDGWGEAKLDAQLQAKGIDPTKLTRHQKLLSLHEGKAVGGAGWTPYFKNPFTGGETAAIAASVPLGIGAALAARRFLG